MSSRKLIAKLNTAFAGVFVKVYRDSEFNEWRVVGASGRPNDYYCTDDKQDAMATAQALVRHVNASASERGEC